MSRAHRVTATIALCAALAAGGGAALWAHARTDGGASALSHSVTVRFDVAAEPGSDWQFKPEQPEMTLRLGETALAFFEAENPTDHTVAGHASYAVSPAVADTYLVRVACFCASQQVLAPHERVQIPMTFYVDPAMARDAAARGIRTITLSYRFRETALPQKQARAASADANIKVN